MEHCIVRNADLGLFRNVISNSIVGSITPHRRDSKQYMHHCAIWGQIDSIVERGEGCFDADPLFRDPANLDYRLLPTSPCIGKASDGGDLGCRYTPEMIEMVQKALELRAQGIIKF